MEAVLSILLNLFSNGIWSLGSYSLSKGMRWLKNREFSREEINQELAPILENALASAIESVKLDEQLSAQRLESFLSSNDVATIVRQIYACLLTPANQEDTRLGEVATEFQKLVEWHLGEFEDRGELEEKLFKMLTTGCKQALEASQTQGILGDITTLASSRLILDELEAIKKNLHFLTNRQLPSIEDIEAFEKRYRQQVSDRHGKITPPFLNLRQRFPIDEIYVTPNFVRFSRDKEQSEKNLRMTEFRQGLYRVVLLGNPGSGKSTFVQKLCYDLVSRYSDRLFAGRQVTPILVVLRDYGAEKKNSNCSILQFIEIRANSDYQVQPPPEAFEYLLLNGRAVVVFDGLDELLDTSDRQDISANVESFCNLYPSVPVLVTSRIVGYEQAPLDKDRFDVFYLSDFNEEQVQEYVTKWFALDPELKKKKQQQQVEAFMTESQTVRDLRSNPLMLGLMCNIYRGEGYIPRNRPDVYEKCAIMLFERWDKSRGINVQLTIEAHIRPTMMYLANWIYGDKSLQTGVTEGKLIEKAADYLCPRRFEDRDEAELAARNFIRFCNGRAWVFTDTGTTKDGEKLYQFTHRTFLEYFTAGHLVRNYKSPEKLAEVLLPKIAQQEWDVVAQLAFQMQNKNWEEAGDELLEAAIQKAGEMTEREKFNLLSFAARCLKFIVPSPRVTRHITNACIEYSLAWGIERMKPRKNQDIDEFSDYRSPGEIIESLIENSATENKGTIADVVEKLVIKKLNGDSEVESVLALEIITYQLVVKESNNFCKTILERICEACFHKIQILSQNNFNFCLQAYHLKKISAVNLIKWYGFGGCFNNSFFMHHVTYGLTSLAYSSLDAAINQNQFDITEVKYKLLQLKQISQILSACLHTLSAKITKPVISESVLSVIEDFQDSTLLLALDSETLFGAFTLFAVMLEKYEIKDMLEILQNIEETKSPFFDSLRWTFIARFKPAEIDKVRPELNRCGFTQKQQAFIWRWVQGQINFVEKTASTETD